jgi:hypothetical protein
MKIGPIVAILVLGFSAPLVFAQDLPRPMAIPLPPMGWSSWNSFSNTVDSEIVEAQAQAMVSTGMKKAGYSYLNIDEGWWLGQRDQQGNIVVDSRQWPAIATGERAGDMSNIVRYLHSLGLKAGIYTDAGMNGCGTYDPDIGPGYPYTGSEEHFVQDFTQFARWGFDYVKIDYCGAGEEYRDAENQYLDIARALEIAETATGHSMFLSICAGRSNPWMWAPNIGGLLTDIWRTGSDIVGPVVADNPKSLLKVTCSKNCPRKASFQKVLRNFDQGIHPDAQHTGFYNDPDMMVLGMPGLSETENKVHMSLWAMSGAPLIAGADLTKLNATDLTLLENPEVIQIDQDPLGLQAVEVTAPRSGLEVWSKRLAAPGERAVLLLNRTGEPTTISVEWSDLGLLGSLDAWQKDVWTGKETHPKTKPIAATVDGGDAVMLLVRGDELPMSHYAPEGAANLPASEFTTAACTGKVFEFAHVASRGGVAAIEIVYTNRDAATRAAGVRVNSQAGTRVTFPPTGAGEQSGAVWIEAKLDEPDSKNAIQFSADCGAALEIKAILMQQ